jgi:hypothetical protein
MKRSEMLGKIAAVIINYNEPHRYTDRDTAIEIARTILAVQEEAGMLPPPDNTDVATGRILYCYYNDYDDDSEGRLVELEDGDGEVDYKRSQLWEKE